MSSRERRLLDKDIEIRKLQGELKHYKTCFFSCVFEKDRTRKALDVARNGLEYIFGYENVPEYVVKHIRQVLDQIKQLTQGNK